MVTQGVKARTPEEDKESLFWQASLLGTIKEGWEGENRTFPLPRGLRTWSFRKGLNQGLCDPHATPGPDALA